MNASPETGSVLTHGQRAAAAIVSVMEDGALPLTKLLPAVAAAIREAVAAEREACAAIADAERHTDASRDDRYHNACDEIAQQIRARATDERSEEAT